MTRDALTDAINAVLRDADAYREARDAAPSSRQTSASNKLVESARALVAVVDGKK